MHLSEPSQLNKSRSKRKALLRAASLKSLERIEREFPGHASVGDELCTTCRNVLDVENVQESFEKMEDPSFSGSVSS